MVVQENLRTDLVSSPLKNDKKHRLKQRFDVMRKLGQGTYGKVQLAINRETGQEVAVKTIKKAKVETEKDLIRIRREIQIMSSIQHPHIIHIYEVFENKDKIVLVMQYARGGELFNYLMEKKVLSDLEARRIFRQIAAAIYYCHKNKICHRDLKLENVLLDEKGNAKIVDFGLSNVFDEKHLLDTYCGSPLYASPEIVKGVPYYGPEVDCWSMGVVLYTLVYGAMPFDGSDFGKLVSQIHEANYFEPKKKSSASELIRRLLTVNPAKRATIVDVCMDYWVNLGYEHSLLQVAEDMANLTPVRLDLLLALAPESSVPQEQSELSDTVDDSEEVLLKANLNKDIPNEEDEDEEDEEYNPDTAANSFSFMKGSHASQLSVSSPNLQDAFSDECEDSESEFLPADIAAALQGECTKRLAESSFGSSLARISSLAHRSKKPKKSNSSKVDLTEASSDKEAKIGNDGVINKSTESFKTSSGKLSVSNSKSSKNSRASLEEKSNSSSSEKIKTEKSGSSIVHNKSSNITPVDSLELQKKKTPKENLDKDQLVKNQKSSSSLEKVAESSEKGQKESVPTQDEKAENKKLGRPPGKIIIPKTFDSPQSSPSPKPVTFKKAAKSEKEPDVKQLENVADSKCLEKSANSTPEDVNKNFIIINANKNAKPDVNIKLSDKKEEIETEKPSMESKTGVECTEEVKPVAITEEQKNIAKGILKKGIAKAKLAERRMSKQNSLESEVSSTCSTPVSTVGTPDPKPSFFKAPKPYAKEGENCKESKAEIKLSSNKNSSSTLKSEIVSNQSAPLWENALHSGERTVQDKNSNWSSVTPTIDSEMGDWKEQMEESLRRLSPDDDRRSSSSSYTATKSEDDKPLVPIARSYKKFTFTKDGACITETKKIYTTPGVDGSWTKVEKKTKITTRPGNAEEFEKFRDLHLRTSSPLTRSDSQSSSGSNDVYDDIFDSWTGDTMMCNMRKMSNMFNKFSRDPFLKKERRRNPFRFFRRTESERSEREKRRYERTVRAGDRESSENEDYDVHYDDSSAVVYGSQGLWQLLRSTNNGFPGRVTIHPEPAWYGRSVSQDRSEANWKRCGSRASSGYNTVTRSQSRDRTESPREKVLRFVLENPRDGFSRESTVCDSPVRHEKWSLKKNGSRHNPRRDSGVGSDGYESEYSIRQSPSDEFSKTGRVSSMSSICSGSRQDMIRNFMKSWSREFTSPPTSPTTLRNTKEQFENLPENRKHRVEQWLHMNSEPPFDFYADSLPGMSSRKSSTSHSNSSSAYATMRPREYFHYNRSSSDKIANSDSDRFPSFEECHRTRSHSLKQDTSSGEMNKIRFRTAAYSPVSEESSKEMHCASDSPGSSVHHINFTISDGGIASSHTTSPHTGGRYSRQFSTSKEGSVIYGSPPSTSMKFEQTSTRVPVQPVVQMRVSFNRGGSRENKVIQVTSQSSPPSKGLWDQQDSDKDSSQDCGLARETSPLPGIRQFSTEVQHSVGSSEKTSRASIDLIHSGKESPNTHTGKKSPFKSKLPSESSIWDMACSQICMENDPALANINLNAQQLQPCENFSYIPEKMYDNRPKQFLPLKREYDVEKVTEPHCFPSASNGANTPDSLEDLTLEQSVQELTSAASEDLMQGHDSLSHNTHETSVNVNSEFHLDIKPVGVLWKSCNSSEDSRDKKEEKRYVAFAHIPNISPTSNDSIGSEVQDVQQKCLASTTSEIGSIWNQKNAGQTFDLLKNLLSDDGLDSFSSSKCVLTSSHSKSNQNNLHYFNDDGNSSHNKSSLEKQISVIDNIELGRITHGGKYKMVPSLMDDLQSPKEVLRQAMKICESFE